MANNQETPDINNKIWRNNEVFVNNCIETNKVVSDQKVLIVYFLYNYKYIWKLFFKSSGRENTKVKSKLTRTIKEWSSTSITFHLFFNRKYKCGIAGSKSSLIKFHNNIIFLFKTKFRACSGVATSYQLVA